MKTWKLGWLLTLCVALLLCPMITFAESGEVNVITSAELAAALADSSVTKICVAGDFTHTTRSLNSGNKVIQINEDVSFTVRGYDLTVSGTFINNGTIIITGDGGSKCIWKANVTGNGTLANQGKGTTYVDYGCAPINMLQNCQINLVKDLAVKPAITLPANMQVGHTIAPTVSNLFDGVDLATVFTFTWRNGSSSQIYNGAAKPTLTETGTLKLTLVPKAPYVLRNSSGRFGSLDAQGTVSLPAFSILYVDAVNGSDNNVGSTSDAPLQTLSKALSNIAENGTIVLLSNCTANEARVQKDHLTIKSKDGEKYCLTLEPTRLMSGVTQMTLDSLLLDVKYIPYSSSSPSAASLLLKNCSGAISATMNDINEVTLEKSEIGGTVYVASKFTLKDSTFTGTFHTKDFAAEGQCTLETIHNSPSKISGTITDDSSVVQVKPAQFQRGELLLEVPDSFSDELVEKLALSDDQSGFYAIQRCKLYNGTYLGVAHRINSANGQLSIWQDPVLGGSVKDLYRNWRGFNWSGSISDSDISAPDVAWKGKDSSST